MKKEIYVNCAVVFFGIVMALILGELIVRDYKAGFQNMILKEGGGLMTHHFRGFYTYHPQLGWVPASYKSYDKWDTTIHTLDDGIRANGGKETNGRDGVVLAFGDSFTFGDEIADHQTWTALLEELTTYKVLNAGVSSYGLDQMILRARSLIPKYHPDIVVVSIIYESLERCRQNVRHGVPKPYFIIEDNNLVLKNQPVPFKSDGKLDFVRGLLGYSHLAHKVMDRLFPAYWWKDTMKDFRYVEGDSNALEIALALLSSLRKALSSETRLMILVQSDINVSETRHLVLEKFLQEVNKRIPNVEICNTVPYFLALKKNNTPEFDKLFLAGGHLSVNGNALTAQLLKQTLSQNAPAKF